MSEHEPPTPEERVVSSPTGEREGVQRALARGQAAERADRGSQHPDKPGKAEVVVHEPAEEEIEPGAELRAMRLVTFWFVASIIGTLGFIVAYVVPPSSVKLQNFLYGGFMGLALFGIGAAAVVWAKKLMPHVDAVEERHPMTSESQDTAALEEIYVQGVGESGFWAYKPVRRAMLAAMGLFPLIFVFPLRDLGPRPAKALRTTPWKKGTRLLLADSKTPIRIGDLHIGTSVTVLPDGVEDAEERTDTPVLLMRLKPGTNHPKKGRENWAVGDHVAYSKICTHAGCPVGLFEQQRQHLLCPCHQSTFEVTEWCTPIFGPATRSLPQLPITLDSDGYFIAADGFHEPIGPGYWWRGRA